MSLEVCVKQNSILLINLINVIFVTLDKGQKCTFAKNFCKC